ncbi:helix-turn-helix transcriptional regulator [Hazenella sp. IB182357]|uniref:Helix-turn-helix transcriptional regulator n=1 Tax=Polycladospora coralii TaxID=2771432 RepID=A0A926RYW0_9BACL|nr:helix-turn-helix transcriptional regulator [Polycladospora coralii]MBD1373876.1 helix-turn-helix transcriptional regulator [Polycladospora coralii]
MTVLKQVRLSRRMTQLQVASLLGITKRMYQYLEASERFPSWKVAQRLEEVFKLPVGELLRQVEAKDERMVQ